MATISKITPIDKKPSVFQGSQLSAPSVTKTTSFAETIFKGASAAFSVSKYVFPSSALALNALAAFKPHLLTSSVFAKSLSITSFIGAGLLCCGGIYDIFKGLIELIQGEKVVKKSKSKSLIQMLDGLYQIAQGVFLILAISGKFSLIAHPWAIPLIYCIPAIFTLIKNGTQLRLILSSGSSYSFSSLKMICDESDNTVLNKLIAESDEIVENKFKIENQIRTERQNIENIEKQIILKRRERNEKSRDTTKTIEILSLTQELEKLREMLRVKEHQYASLGLKEEKIRRLSMKIGTMNKKLFIRNLILSTLTSLLNIAAFAISFGPIVPIIDHLISYSQSTIGGIALSIACSTKIQSFFIDHSWFVKYIVKLPSPSTPQNGSEITIDRNDSNIDDPNEIEDEMPDILNPDASKPSISRQILRPFSQKSIPVTPKHFPSLDANSFDESAQ
jgi:hypothetical protein